MRSEIEKLRAELRNATRACPVCDHGVDDTLVRCTCFDHEIPTATEILTRLDAILALPDPVTATVEECCKTACYQCGMGMSIRRNNAGEWRHTDKFGGGCNASRTREHFYQKGLRNETE